MRKVFDEFKAFILRGNVIDMAIGVVIATAFGKITTSRAFITKLQKQL